MILQVYTDKTVAGRLTHVQEDEGEVRVLKIVRPVWAELVCIGAGERTNIRITKKHLLRCWAEYARIETNLDTR